jgi:phosphopantetheine adenylyltransferase
LFLDQHPVGIPNQKIFTSGNMNVIEETSAPVKNTVVEQSIPKEKQITPTVEATHVPINKEITEFQDVAVSKVRNFLGLGVNEQTIVEDVVRTLRMKVQEELYNETLLVPVKCNIVI